MILLHIASASDSELTHIATLLLKEKLVADVRIDTIRRLLLNDDGKLEEVPRFLLICKTKALLFSSIVDFIRDNNNSGLPEIYALPLVSMERSQEEKVRLHTRQV
jgi:uncharacterized protein involved in tolerance to divalent cations